MNTTATPHTIGQAADEQMCTMCLGQGGTWETVDGQSPGRAITRWIKCRGCNGRGKV